MADFIFGKNTVTAYLKSNQPLGDLYLFNKGSYPDIVAIARKKQVKINYVDKKKLDRMVEGAHQGVVLQVEAFRYYDLAEVIAAATGQLIVVCDQLEDPHNLGAILRTCDASGADAVVIGKHRSVSLNATVAKVSTGAINTVKVVQAGNIVTALKTLKNEGYWVIGAENDDKAVDYTSFAVDVPLVVVVGSEGKGLSRLVKEECDVLIKIEMLGSVNSLNVSVATGVVLFDIVRRRREGTIGE